MNAYTCASLCIHSMPMKPRHLPFFTLLHHQAEALQAGIPIPPQCLHD